MEHVSRRNNTRYFEDYVQEWDFAVLQQLTPCTVHYSNLVPINLVPSLCYMDYHTIDLSLYCSSSSVGVSPVWHQFQKSLLSGQTNHCHLLDKKKKKKRSQYVINSIIKKVKNQKYYLVINMEMLVNKWWTAKWNSYWYTCT